MASGAVIAIGAAFGKLNVANELGFSVIYDFDYTLEEKANLFEK